MKVFKAIGQSFSKPGRAINLDDDSYDQVLIDRCTFTNTAGIFIQAKAGMKIEITNCRALNILKTPDLEYAQFVQVSGYVEGKLQSVPVSLHISGNRVENIPGQCDSEDLINLICLSGSASNPLLIEGNTLIGSYPKDLSKESLKNFSGSGIMLDRMTNYALIQRNHIEETTNVGIGIAGGSSNIVRLNTVTAKKGQNVGIYSANQYKQDLFKNNVVKSNTVSWETPNGRNDYYLP